MEPDEYARYGRQMLVPEIGLPGQLALRRARVLVVGAGGLGCGALPYLAGAGVGTLAIVDHDTVALSNLHRQPLYTVDSVGMLKVDAAAVELRRRNPGVHYVAMPLRLSPETAFAVFDEGYDIVLDCTDTAVTRYLVGDVARLLNIPLVSAAALRGDAQLLVVNTEIANSPCYRCVYPSPPPPLLLAPTSASCADAGVLGPVVGLAGALQALEAIRILTGNGATETRGTALLYSMFSPARQWRQFTPRPRRLECATCGDSPKITRELIESSGDEYYVEFCGGRRGRTDGGESEEQQSDGTPQISVEDLERARDEHTPHVLIDVRDDTQYGICALPGVLHMPLRDMLQGIASDNDESTITRLQDARAVFGGDTQVPFYVVCRTGVDSRTAVRLLRSQYGVDAYDVAGGLDSWSTRIDPTFPRY
ncbi:uncharacterized protein V1518DRAFT_420025 [Limtongia smithiae]|uniref:uncharacterized protein n=1 Tax=Limtongia smithiae TaxID=1125753 RepID=UPI0034CFB83D